MLGWAFVVMIAFGVFVIVVKATYFVRRIREEKRISDLENSIREDAIKSSGRNTTIPSD